MAGNSSSEGKTVGYPIAGQGFLEREKDSGDDNGDASSIEHDGNRLPRHKAGDGGRLFKERQDSRAEPNGIDDLERKTRSGA